MDHGGYGTLWTLLCYCEVVVVLQDNEMKECCSEECARSAAAEVQLIVQLPHYRHFVLWVTVVQSRMWGLINWLPSAALQGALTMEDGHIRYVYLSTRTVLHCTATERYCAERLTCDSYKPRMNHACLPNTNPAVSLSILVPTYSVGV